MSAVIEFPAHRSRKPARAALSLAGEVIIFPGVRVERMEFSLADRLPMRGGRPAIQAQLQEDYDHI